MFFDGIALVLLVWNTGNTDMHIYTIGLANADVTLLKLLRKRVLARQSSVMAITTQWILHSYQALVGRSRNNIDVMI